MKATVLLVSCMTALLLVVAIPGALRAPEAPTRLPSAEQASPVLCGNVSSGAPCHLKVEAGPETAFDRGTLASAAEGAITAGSYRYWEEKSGRVLYVYDDVQNLLVRVVNPKSVRVLD